MSKKKLFVIFLIASVACIAHENKTTFQCAFCQKKILDKQKFYEDDLVIALYTHKPIEPCHLLILPKRHVERYEELTEKELAQIARVIKKVHRAATFVFETSSYLLHLTSPKKWKRSRAKRSSCTLSLYIKKGRGQFFTEICHKTTVCSNPRTHFTRRNKKKNKSSFSSHSNAKCCR